MKKDYIVELREEEADELMNDHWVGELVWCKDCKWFHHNSTCYNEKVRFGCYRKPDWFCADGERKES